VNRAIGCVILVAACAGPAADHERLADASYVRGEYPAALAEYRAAAKISPSARVSAKQGAAALHAGEIREAAEAYRQLAAQDGSRADEAATGLELVAKEAERTGDGTALQTAVVALRTVAPNRLVARYTLGLARSGKLGAEETTAILPAALAAASDAATADSLLVLYATASRETTACEDAAGAYEAVLRRSHDAALRPRAADGYAMCANQLGEEALSVERPEVAAHWFGKAATLDSGSTAGRRALVGLGDARIKLGDILGAAIAYQDAVQGESADSISTLARQRLAGLAGSANAGDSN
jgi:tetratricopeptide (TPR) repeat protein